jgi:hypothetical protein
MQDGFERPKREPIFNNWRYAAVFALFLLFLLGLRLAAGN